MGKSYWENESKDYHDTLDTEKIVLHPYIADLINNIEGERLLDFGCGNGYLASLIRKGVEISLYDISDVFLDVKKRWKIDNDIILCRSLSDIKNVYYDIVVQSSVLMCIPDRKSLNSILESNYNSLKTGGHLVISITHPCFLQYEYGHYKTSYNHNNFNYLSDESEYKVFMKRKDKGELIFIDYNWSLSTIINQLLYQGFELVKMIEHPDLPSEDFETTEEGCPWMFLVLKK